MERTITTSQKDKPHPYFEHSSLHHKWKCLNHFECKLYNTKKTQNQPKCFSFKSRCPLCSCVPPLLHNSHHSPPFKSKTTNIILIPKLLHTLKYKLIITLKLPPKNFSVNENTTKAKTVFMTNDKNQCVHTIALRTFHPSFSIIVQCLM